MSTLHSHFEFSRRPSRAGAAMVLMLLMLVIVIGMVAFSVDTGLTVLLRSEIQNAVDSGALAAGLELQRNPEGIQAAEDAARRFVQLNRVGMGKLVPADAIDVEHGRFDSETNTFTATDYSPNAVRVFARQEDEPFFFARIFGQTTFGAPASALAAGDPRPIDIMMVLDLSGSMKTNGRIQALWHSAPVFVDIFDQADDDDQIGVMGLAADPGDYDPSRRGHFGTLYVSGLHPTSDHYVGVLEASLTQDFDYLRDTVLSRRNLEAGKYTSWTGTGAAIGDAAHYLTHGSEARDDAEKVIVLMSDGYANRPSGNGAGYARAMGSYAAGLDITIYTISLGSQADLDLMQDIADIAEGEHFEATGDHHLDTTGSGWGTLTHQLTEAFQQAAYAIKRVQLVR